jgi:hypothetical protein
MVMKALEFKSKIRNNTIVIPEQIQFEISETSQNDVRVIVLIEDPKAREDFTFQSATTSKFFEGYSESDSIYDHQ